MLYLNRVEEKQIYAPQKPILEIHKLEKVPT